MWMVCIMENKTETTIIEQLIGKTFNAVENLNDEELVFIGNESYRFHHYQDCCESVMIEDICGDLKDLEGSPILRAEETTKDGTDQEAYDDSLTWTFYRIETEKGGVVVRWRGESNGYYSESVDFDPISIEEARDYASRIESARAK